MEDWPTSLLIDTGFTDPDDDAVGVALDAPTYESIVSRLRDQKLIAIDVVGGEVRMAPSGIGRVSLEGLDGTASEVRMVLAGENLLGVPYLHGLRDFNITWELAARTMTIARRS